MLPRLAGTLPGGLDPTVHLQASEQRRCYTSEGKHEQNHVAPYPPHCDGLAKRHLIMMGHGEEISDRATLRIAVTDRNRAQDGDGSMWMRMPGYLPACLPACLVAVEAEVRRCADSVPGRC